MKLQDAYLSVHEALKHAGLHNGCRVHVRWVDAEDMTIDEAALALERKRGTVSTQLTRARDKVEEMAKESRRETELGMRRRPGG